MVCFFLFKSCKLEAFPLFCLLLLLPWIEAVEKRLLVNPEHPFQGGDGQSDSLQRYQWHLWIENYPLADYSYRMFFVTL